MQYKHAQPPEVPLAAQPAGWCGTCSNHLWKPSSGALDVMSCMPRRAAVPQRRSGPKCGLTAKQRHGSHRGDRPHRARLGAAKRYRDLNICTSWERISGSQSSLQLTAPQSGHGLVCCTGSLAAG